MAYGFHTYGIQYYAMMNKWNDEETGPENQNVENVGTLNCSYVYDDNLTYHNISLSQLYNSYIGRSPGNSRNQYPTEPVNLSFSERSNIIIDHHSHNGDTSRQMFVASALGHLAVGLSIVFVLSYLFLLRLFRDDMIIPTSLWNIITESL
jgi:hypothetical protein